MESKKQIMFYGPSGTGKTTLAKYISDHYNIPFISGSISDLIPSTKSLSHSEMINRDPKDIYKEDLQLLNLRGKKFNNVGNFVSDRSYLDIIAYHIIKVSKDLSKCDTESLFSIVKNLMMRDCTHLIFIPFTNKMIDEWKIEDNNKRILNPYFQWNVSLVMENILDLLGFNYYMLSDNMGYSKILNNLQILVLKQTSMDYRIKCIDRFLD